MLSNVCTYRHRETERRQEVFNELTRTRMQQRLYSVNLAALLAAAAAAAAAIARQWRIKVAMRRHVCQ